MSALSIDIAAPVGAVVLWGSLWLQLAIVPFFGKQEKLYELHKKGGSIDAAMSKIDSGQTIPALATIFDTALSAQEDRRKTPDIEQLLSRVEYSQHLETLESAGQAKAKILSSYETLVKQARLVWQFGLLHILLIIPGLLLLYVQVPGLWAVSAAVVFLTLSGLGAVVSAIGLIRFHKLMGLFLELLEPHHA